MNERLLRSKIVRDNLRRESTFGRQAERIPRAIYTAIRSKIVRDNLRRELAFAGRQTEHAPRRKSN